MKSSRTLIVGLVAVTALTMGAAFAQPEKKSPAPDTPGAKPPAAAELKPALPPIPPPPAPPASPAAQLPSSDPTQAQQPLLNVYSLTKGAKATELPVLALKGRVLGNGAAGALLSVDGNPFPVLVRAGVTVPLAGPKHAGFQLEVTKVDELGVHATLTRLGQDGTPGLSLIVY